MPVDSIDMNTYHKIRVKNIFVQMFDNIQVSICDLSVNKQVMHCSRARKRASLFHEPESVHRMIRLMFTNVVISKIKILIKKRQHYVYVKWSHSGHIQVSAIGP